VNLTLDSRLQVAGFLGGEIALHRDAHDIETALLDVVLLATYQPLPYGLQMPYLARSVCTRLGKSKCVAELLSNLRQPSVSKSLTRSGRCSLPVSESLRGRVVRLTLRMSTSLSILLVPGRHRVQVPTIIPTRH
jgi:hypothetical protein